MSLQWTGRRRLIISYFMVDSEKAKNIRVTECIKSPSLQWTYGVLKTKMTVRRSETPVSLQWTQLGDRRVSWTAVNA